MGPSPQADTTGHRPSPLLLDDDERAKLWRDLVESIERFARDVDKAPVAPPSLDPAAIRSRLDALDLDAPMASSDALSFAVDNLWAHQVHTPHPSYYGLFNPAPSTMGISVPRLSRNRAALRACITNYRTTAEHLDALIEALGRARSAV